MRDLAHSHAAPFSAPQAHILRRMITAAPFFLPGCTGHCPAPSFSQAFFLNLSPLPACFLNLLLARPSSPVARELPEVRALLRPATLIPPFCRGWSSHEKPGESKPRQKEKQVGQRSVRAKSRPWVRDRTADLGKELSPNPPPKPAGQEPVWAATPCTAGATPGFLGEVAWGRNGRRSGWESTQREGGSWPRLDKTSFCP